MSAEISMLLPKAIPDFSKWHSHTTMVVQHYGQWQDHWHFPAPYSAHPQSFSSVRSEFHYLSHPSFLDWLPTTALTHIYASGNCVQFSLVAQSCPTLRPHESQHARPPCPSPTPRVHSDPRPLSQWCHPAISSSVIPSPPAFKLSQH